MLLELFFPATLYKSLSQKVLNLGLFTALLQFLLDETLFHCDIVLTINSENVKKNGFFHLLYHSYDQKHKLLIVKL